MSSPPLAAVALLSAAVLGYEILLTRLFSIILWHHFAYMIISVAMLGYGAAGTFVALGQRILLPRFAAIFVAAAAAFGVTAVAGFLAAQTIEFNPLELLWDSRQPLKLLGVYALLVVPFFCAATSICLTFTRFAGEPHRIYSFDILGAGAGCLAILTALFLVTPSQALTLIGALGLLAAALAARSLEARPRWPAFALLGGALLALALPSSWTALHPSEYKALSQTLAIKDARIVAERSGPLGLVSVVASPTILFRHAPGMSLNAAAEPPPQLGVFVDGDGPSALTRYAGRSEPLAYLDQLTSALPYHLTERPRVLVLGAGAGADVLQAIHAGARSIDAVELDPQIIDLVQRRFADFSGAPYSAPGVTVHIGEARGYVAGHGGRFDLIQVALLDAFAVSSAGLHALSESYLYTIEALREYLDRLEPGGLLAITRWVNLPPRDALKLFATAVAALEERGVAPAERLALIRGWKTTTLVVKNDAFTTGELDALKEFCRVRSFDVAYYPGIDAAEANRYNVLERPDFHDGALALLGPQRDAFLARYKFNLAPATDDRPYYFQFFKWRTLPELLSLKQQGGLPLLEWGYPVLIATLLQAVLVGALLILAPLWVVRRRDLADQSRLRSRIALYFAAIGLAFMFVEIAFIQKFILFLAHPLYAVAVVLCAFLVFAGLGSRYSRRLARGEDAAPASLARIALAIALIGVSYVYGLPVLFRPLMPLPDAAKIAVSIALIAPLAFAMGMPFPLGLVRVARREPLFVAWGWGINACTSVVAAILATLLAIHFGFTSVVLLAVALYALAPVAYRSI